MFKASGATDKPKPTEGTVTEKSNKNDTGVETDGDNEVVVKKKTILLTFPGNFSALGLDNDTKKEEVCLKIILGMALKFLHL